MIMRMSLAFGGLLWLWLVVPGLADVFEMPDDDSVVSVALPDGWRATASQRGAIVDAASPDGAVTIHLECVEASKASTVQAGLLTGPVWGQPADPASETQDMLRIAARHASDYAYRVAGSGDGRIRLIRMETVPGQVLLAMIRGREAALRAQAPAIDRMLDGLKVLDN